MINTELIVVRIGIDIDDTICCSIENMLPYICKFYNLNYEVEKAKCLSYDAYHGLPNYREFANLTYESVMPNARLKEKANYYINLLSELGHEIIFITARSDFVIYKIYKLSKEYLEKYNIHYDKLVVGAREKGKVCIEESIDIFIDDNLRNCHNVEESNIKVWLFHNNFNKDDKHFDRVNDWEDVYNRILNKKINL